MTLENSLELSKFKYLNIGGGNFEHRSEGWLNLDYPFDAMARKRDFSNIDIIHNLMSSNRLPIPDNSFEVVYAEHVIEHLPTDAARYVFHEVFRILKPFGSFRISVPDAQKCWDVLIDDALTVDEYPSSWHRKNQINTKEMAFADALYTPLRRAIGPEELRELIDRDSFDGTMAKMYGRLPEPDLETQARRPGDHLSWWNCSRLFIYLRTCGFTDVVGPLGCRESRHPALRCDHIDRTQHKWSVRVEGRKHG